MVDGLVRHIECMGMEKTRQDFKEKKKMKILLTLFICSTVAGECMPPYQWPDAFKDEYDCMLFGYEESKKKLIEMGSSDVNQYKMWIKFTCTPLKTI